MPSDELRRSLSPHLFPQGTFLSEDKKGLYIANPIYEIGKSAEFLPDSLFSEDAGEQDQNSILPTYPETFGVSSRWFQFAINKSFKKISSCGNHIFDDYLPDEILKQYSLPTLKSALMYIHIPKSKKDADVAKKRFAFEEMFFIQLNRIKQKIIQKSLPSFKISISENDYKNFSNSLPFKLTNAQKKAISHISEDFKKPSSMARLLEGDVGSGKTVVSAIAALQTIQAGYKVAVMAPTEILAKQHYKEFKNLLPKTKISLLTGKEKESLDAQIIIGTHALLYTKKEIQNLGLAIIDEQHRFGIKQRSRLANAHLLTMTATPIPRTLALTVYGDLKISLLDELPQGRKPIITKVVAPANRRSAYSFIKKEIAKGRQAFVICPLVEESDVLQSKAVKQEYKKLNEDIFPELKIEYIHGKLKEKQEQSKENQ